MPGYTHLLVARLGLDALVAGTKAQESTMVISLSHLIKPRFLVHNE